jgi:putative acetyltransferase
MSEYNIKSPVETDFDNLINLWEKAVRATHHFLKEEDLIIYKQLLIKQYFKDVDLYCVFLNEEIAGFIGIEEKNIEMLFIDPQHFSKGIGKALMQYAIIHLKCDRVAVNEQNTKAFTFYRKLGFKPVSRVLKDGLGKPYPLIQMKIDI